jgi:hypothetical protein
LALTKNHCGRHLDCLQHSFVEISQQTEPLAVASGCQVRGQWLTSINGVVAHKTIYEALIELRIRSLPQAVLRLELLLVS